LPKVSIITACAPNAAQFLSEAWCSIKSSVLPVGWQIEWCLQEDGPDRTVDPLLVSQPTISYDVNGCSLGTATTRNLALVRSVGDIVVGLDADDMLAPGGLLALVKAVSVSSLLAWSVGRDCHLMPNGELVNQVASLRPGVYRPGEVVEKWLELGRAPFRSSLACMRTKAVWRVGGWPALGRLDDAALVYALSALYPGVIVPDNTLIYRRWSGQKTIQDWSKNLIAPSKDFTVRWVRAMTEDCKDSR